MGYAPPGKRGCGDSDRERERERREDMVVRRQVGPGLEVQAQALR